MMKTQTQSIEIKKGKTYTDVTMPKAIAYRATGKKIKGGYFDDYQISYQFEEISQTIDGPWKIGMVYRTENYINDYMK